VKIFVDPALMAREGRNSRQVLKLEDYKKIPQGNNVK
jgi:hypothetical protein